MRSFAELAVRFYNKLVLAPFTPEETFKPNSMYREAKSA
jgi:hypothetical protein